MKKIIITENERNNILKIYGILLEQENLTPAQMLDKIQISVGTNNDLKIGPDTTSKIVSALKDIPTKKFDYSCVVNHPNVEVVERIDGTNEYQIGDLLFQRNGTYFDLNEPNKPLTYTCNGNIIQTSNHKDITSETKKDNSEEIKKMITRLRDEQEATDEQLKNVLLKIYSKEDIIKADPSLAPLFGTTSTETKPEAKVETKPQMLNGEMVADENNIFDTVFDKMGNRPINPIGSKP
jgi:hypothetical protein